MSDAMQERFALTFDHDTYRRIIAGKEVIIHCHHYNARLQRTIEGTRDVDGEQIFRDSAEVVMAEHIAGAFEEGDDEDTRWQVAAALYKHLGFGSLDVSEAPEGVVTATASHFVEGWRAGMEVRDTPVCSFACGFIQGAWRAIYGESADVTESGCIICGDDACRFEIDASVEREPSPMHKEPVDFAPDSRGGFVASDSVDEERIVSALAEMPIHGDAYGLIPAFSVYLGNMPADFYNLVCIRFVEAMGELGRARTAIRLLTADAETCGMNTFRGIMNSAEWDGLVGPMIQRQSDNLHGIVAVSNALGWGNWHVREHTPGESLVMESLNGYEAIGYRQLRGSSDVVRCYMLTGVAAGIMELIYGRGTVEERFGTCFSHEDSCITEGATFCTIGVEKA